MNLNSSKSNIINYRDIIIFLVPILIFSLYLYVYNPGILTAASFSQLHQIATGDFTNAYPILHTFIEILCLKIMSSPLLIGILQILVFCVMWTVICKYHRDDTSKNSDGFVFQFILTLIICLVPMNAVYSITLSSNILFSYALMFLCFLIKVLIDNDGQIDNKLTILIALTITTISGLNTFGVMIAVILLILIVRYLFKKGNTKDTLIRLAAITIVCILLVTSLNFIYDADQDNMNFKMNDAFDDGVNLQGARSEFLESSNATPVEEYENAASVNFGNNKYDMIDSYGNLFRDNFILGGLFDNPIVYLIFSVILLGFIYLTGQSEIYHVYVPIIVSVIIALITGRNNYYYVLLGFYMIAIIFINLYIKLSLKPQELIDLAIAKSKDLKSVKPQPHESYEYIEPEQESYDNNYSYIEAELEDLTLDDINEMLEDSLVDKTPRREETLQEEINTSNSEQNSDDDLINQILKEIELEKK